MDMPMTGQAISGKIVYGKYGNFTLTVPNKNSYGDYKLEGSWGYQGHNILTECYAGGCQNNTLTTVTPNHIEVFGNSGEEEENEELINAFWTIHRECIQQAFPEVSIYGWQFDYKKDGWKEFVHLQIQHPQQTYDNFIKNYSKNGRWK